MKWRVSVWFAIVAVGLVVTPSTTAAAAKHFNLDNLLKKFHKDNENGTIFIKSLRHLQRGPPIELSTEQAQTRDLIDVKWFEQPVDHFDKNNKKTWKMRYMVNDAYFKESGPIFIYVGGEWTISPVSIMFGHFVDLAKEHNGILYYTEHRYYGESRPTADFTVENLKYLHVKQALADLVHFIKEQRSSHAALANAKVIMAGGSYAATMVVWFKHLYPELLAGGWASSAPLFAKVDYKEYKEVMGHSIKILGGQRCYNRIQNGIAELEQMFATKRAAEVKAMMKICNNFDENNDLDLWSLFGIISNLFAGIVQYQTKSDIPSLCEFLMAQEDDASAIASFVLLYVQGCLDPTYKASLNFYMDSSYAAGASRPWYYQTCNEYGWFQTSGSRAQPFGTKFPALLFTTLCGDIFGDAFTNEKINTNTAQTNIDFGGMSPTIENIHMTHGELDPWNAVGHNVTHGAVILPLESHCTDFSSISSSDTAEMRASKELLAVLVREWLKSDKDDN